MSLQINALSVVVPMYNEEENVKPLVEEIQQGIQSIEAAEIIIVDDGSTDATVAELKKLQQTMPNLRVVCHKGNFGQSAGIVSGVRAAKHPWIATLDGDGQNDPADIPKLIAEAGKHLPQTSKVLIAGHRNKRNDNWLRLLSSRVANGVRGRLLRDDCPDTGCGLKIFPRQDFLNMPHFNHVHRFMPALFKRSGGLVKNVPVNHRPRVRGQSKYGVMNRLWVGIFDMFGVVWLIRRPCNPEVNNEPC